MSKDDKPLLMDGFEKAFMGVLRRFGQENSIAVYDYNRCVNILMERDGMEEDEAVEWIEHNCLGAWLGESTPSMVFRCTLNELHEEFGDKPVKNERDYGDEHPEEEDEDEEMSEEEQEIVNEALMNFSLNFMRYIQEVDQNMYRRAKQYAMDYSGNTMVEFIDEDDTENKEEDTK
jgi:hypothetical protein